MPRKRLTEEGVRKLKPPTKGKQVDYFDAGMPGLVLRMNYGGRKTWRALYYVKGVDKDGKHRTEPRTHPLGLYPILSLKEAREAARRFLAAPQKALADAGTSSFKEIAEDFVRRHVEANSLRSQAEIERCLNKYILPRWERRGFRELKRGDVAALLDQIEDDHGARQADICLAIIRKLMHWYQARNDDYVSPVVRGMNRYKPADHKGKRILNDKEIRALWVCTAEMGTYGALVRLLLLTAQRCAKVAAMQWNDLRDGVWTIPTEHREKGNAERLRLPQLALDVITKQARLAGSPYVFAVAGGKGCFNSFSQRKDELDQKLKQMLPDMPPWILHDLRRTARSLLSRAGVRPEVAERVLGHAIQGVEGVYDRHSYDEERAAALSRLARLIEPIINFQNDNLVDLSAAP
jgi:integrase